jgi:hypothetical protein
MKSPELGWSESIEVSCDAWELRETTSAFGRWPNSLYHSFVE